MATSRRTRTAPVEPPVQPIVIGRDYGRRLDLTLARGSIADVNARAVVLGVFANVDPQGAANAVDARVDGAIKEIVRGRMFAADSGSLFILPTARTALRSDFVVLAGLGPFDRFGPPVVELVASNVARTLVRAGVEEFATILLGGSSGQDVTTCTAHLLRGVMAGLRETDVLHRFRGLTLVEIDAAKFGAIRDEAYAACREGFCDDFQIVVRSHDLPATDRGAASTSGSPYPSSSLVYLLVRTEQRTSTELTLKTAALTAGAKAALVDDRIAIDLQTLQPLLATLDRPGLSAADMAALGQQLADLVLPARLRTELRRFRQHHLTLVLDRDATLIPWETLQVAEWAPALSAGLSRRYLADDVAVARWSEQRKSDPQLRVLLVINPTGDLPAAEREGARIQQLAAGHPEIRIDPLAGRDATADVVLDAFRSEAFDVVHYAGHASFDKERPGQSGLMCADRTLTAVELLNIRSLPALMFFNACESARVRRGTPTRQGTQPAAGLSTATGFAESLMRAGVANYIGTYWPVGDTSAEACAATFYEAVLNGESLGAALLSARRAVRAVSPIDWADYIHYGDPDFRLKRERHREAPAARRTKPAGRPRWRRS